MGNGTASREESEAGKVKRFRWARWNAPLVLLLLSFTFMIVMILSNKSQTIPNDGSFTPYVLAALLCTLVAVSITLIGCASKQTDRHTQSADSDTSTNNQLLRTCQASLSANEQNTTKISRLAESQRQMLDTLAEFKNLIENRHESLDKTTEGLKQEMAKSLAAVTSSNQAMKARIEGLLLAGKLMSGRIGETVEKQESLCEAVQQHDGLLDDRMSDLAEDHHVLLQRIKEL